MKKKEKISFIRQLTKSVADEIVLKIRNNRIPEKWDGVELRQYLADKFSSSSVLRHDKRRRREYYIDVERLNL